MIGTKFYKSKYIQEEYTQCAEWCNENNAYIEDKGEYYEVIAIPAPSLDELKQVKINEFKVIRDAEEVKPIEYNGNLFDFDEKSRDRINNAIIALDVNGYDSSLEWTLADNTNTIVTSRDLHGVVANVASRSNQLHIKYRDLKEQIEACTTKEELDEIQWEK